MQQVAKHGPFGSLRAQLVPVIRRFAPQPIQCRTHAIPSGQMKTSLAPTEYPRDGAQVIERTSARAPRGPGANLRPLHCINGSGRTEERDKSLRFYQSAISLVALLRHLIPNIFERMRRIAFLMYMQQRRPGDARQQPLQMISGRQAIGVFLRDHLALFGNAHPAHQRTGGQCIQKMMCGACPAAHGSTASVK